MPQEKRERKRRSLFGIEDEETKQKFLSKLRVSKDVSDRYDRYDPIAVVRLVATEEEWARYKRIGWQLEPHLWLLLNQEERKNSVYGQLLKLLEIFYARIRRHLMNFEWTAAGYCARAGKRREIQAEEWIILDNPLLDGVARSDSTVISDLVFRLTPKLECGRSKMEQWEAEAVEFATSLADSNPERQLADVIDAKIRERFPQANFSKRALVRIHNGAKLHARGILGSGPIPRN